ncbi:MAG: L,D-transpeptidase family protein [Thermoguttaceae bacterium]|nr:L,D-transpeptidase family protein [Thermoguttaceae bacterium]
MKTIITLFAVYSLAFCGAIVAQDLVPDLLPETQPPETLQLIRVVVSSPGGSEATVSRYSRESASAPWQIVLPKMSAMIGRAGLAPQGEKREKDGKTPSAEFGVGCVFGKEPQAPEGLKLPYRQATSADFWIDEDGDPRYNRWISGEKPDVSHENLILNDPRYDLSLISMYNVNPTTNSKGSAIFLHVWKEPGYPTSGCVSLSRQDVLTILRWLDPKKEPRIRVELAKDDDR